MITNVLQYLERSAENFPEKIAIADTNRKLTYRELAAEAKAVGTALAAYGFYEQPVAVATDHSVECLVMFLGIVYSGNFYVPVDAQLPAGRIRAILDVSCPPLVIVPQKDADKFCELAGDDRLLVREKISRTEADEDRLRQIRAHHLDTAPLYLMFTSGSTGVPKGVLICHRSVVDLAEQFAEVFHFEESDVFGNQAPFDFDVSVKDIYNTLRNGATLYIIPKAMFSMPKLLIPYLNENKVSVIIWAVSALSILTTLKVLEKSRPLYLKKIMFSGEVMPVRVLNDWRCHIPDAMYVNLYGPTEITCNCTYYIVEREFAAQEELPIGRAFPNTEILLLDEEERRVSAGETGEICVRGTCLAHGYYRNPIATEQAFRQNPYNRAYPEKIYHTGDYGRLNGNGELMFAARRDWQIKHMGHRIELSEIESAVNAFAWIERCCCQFDEKRGRILLFYQSGERDDARLLTELKEELPKYMCPNQLMWMKKMPVNRRGKTDRVYLKQRYTQKSGLPIYKEAIVLGTGTLALQCAQALKEKDVHCTLYDTGEQPSEILKRQAVKKEILCRSVSRGELKRYLEDICTPTLVVSAINPWILPTSVVENPYLLIVNCHQALLPAHPGRNAEMWSIYEGDEKTGITWHLLSSEVDRGEILIQKEMRLTPKHTSLTVFREQSRMALTAFTEILENLIADTCTARPQTGERQKLRYSWEEPADGKVPLAGSFREVSAFLRAYDYGGLEVLPKPRIEWEGGVYTYGGYRIEDGASEAQNSRTEIAFSEEGLWMTWPTGRILLKNIQKVNGGKETWKN